MEVEGADSHGEMDFPEGVRHCHSGPGTGAGASAAEETCGLKGLMRDPSVAMRRAKLGAGKTSPEDLAAALGGVRSSKVLHFDSMVGRSTLKARNLRQYCLFRLELFS